MGNRNTCQRDESIPTAPPVTNPPVTPPTVSPPDIYDICVGTNMGFLPDPRSCTGFILCIFEQPDFHQCPAHSPIFDHPNQQCVGGKFLRFVMIKRP